MADNVVLDGVVYPDEFSATAVNHPDIPDSLKTEFKQALESPEKPAGALKTDEGTPPTTRITVHPAASVEAPDYNYDAWKQANPGVEMAPGQHYPDTYKFPNHITFSDESIYHGVDGNQGGHWGTDEQGKDTFTPGPTNLQNHSLSDIQDYFRRVEPDVKLIIPDTAAGQASQATQMAQDALNRAKGTPPSLDSDTGIRGSVVAGTPEYLRKLGIDTTVTDQDVNNAIDMGLSFSGGGLSTKRVPISEDIPGSSAFDVKYGYVHPGDEVKAQRAADYWSQQEKQTFGTSHPEYDYEQMGNGKYELFNIKTGKTFATVNSAKEAEDFINQIPLQETPPVDHTKNALDEIQKILDALDAQDSIQNGTKPKNPDNPLYKQEPLYYHEKTATWENHPEEVAKLSPKEAFMQGVADTRQKFKATMAEIISKFKPAYEAPRPKVAPVGDYTEPAYRGLSTHGSFEGANPNFKYKTGQLYSTAHPELADMYASYLSSHPGHTVPPGTFAETAQVMPLLINTKDYHYYDAKGAHWTVSNGKAIEEANKLGKKGVIVDNVFDEPNSTKALKKPKKVYITFPQGASTVKSRFAARFDPSSPNMMHTIAGIGVGSGTLGFISEENNQQ